MCLKYVKCTYDFYDNIDLEMNSVVQEKKKKNKKKKVVRTNTNNLD